MPIALGCTNCGRNFKVADHLAGRKVKCPQCSAVVNAGAVAASDSPTVKSGETKEEASRPADWPKKKRRRAKPGAGGTRWILWSALGLVVAVAVIGIIVLVVRVVNSLPDGEGAELAIGDVIRAAQESTDKETLPVSKRHKGKTVRWEGVVNGKIDKGVSVIHVQVSSRRASLFDGAKVHVFNHVARVQLKEPLANPLTRGQKVTFEGNIGERIYNRSEDSSEVVDQNDKTITFETVRLHTTTVEIENGQVISAE